MSREAVPDNAALREALAKSDAIRVTEEENGWGVTLPELPGHVGAGDTLEEAVAMALDAAAAWGAPASPSGSSPVVALREFLRHKDGCASGWGMAVLDERDMSCDCGLRAALAADPEEAGR